MVVEEVFAVIAEGTRRDILEALAGEHKAVGQLVEELGVSQPTVSKHLRVLREAGVVTMRAQGQKRFYSINTEPLSLVAEWLDGLGAGVARGARPAAGSAAGSGAAPAAAARTAVAARNGAPAGGPATIDDGGPSRSPAIDGRTDPAGARPALEPAAQAAPAARPALEPAAGIALATGAVRAAAPADAARAAVVVPAGGQDPSVQQHITRSVGRAANKAADLLANLPAFRRRRD
ncbi:transcriptional regulator [Arthrobacter livingstonensis]|uniref:Transcriptional regulator n=1 Tax=Arthrobacter livingstonensis TaxID=670078 RepID=A0A2V5L7B2_9MICC|nr:metalloregulator ArsR/SmtB family transcription factor [Arthrobacter livingstonensis]PYI66194.1 transcriptional regulator [Arthrobacter livingstonensis]